MFSDSGLAYGIGIAIGVGGAFALLALLYCYCRSRRRVQPAAVEESAPREAEAGEYRVQQSAASTQDLEDVEFEFQRVQSQRRAAKLSQAPTRVVAQPPPKVTLEMIQADPELDGSLKDVQAEQLGNTVSASAFDTTVNNLDGTINSNPQNSS